MDSESGELDPGAEHAPESVGSCWSFSAPTCRSPHSCRTASDNDESDSAESLGSADESEEEDSSVDERELSSSGEEGENDICNSTEISTSDEEADDCEDDELRSQNNDNDFDSEERSQAANELDEISIQSTQKDEDEHELLGTQFEIGGAACYYRESCGALAVNHAVVVMDEAATEDFKRTDSKLLAKLEFPFNMSKKGTYSIVVDPESYATPQDVQFDRFSSWNKKGVVLCKTGVQRSHEKDIRFYRGVHPKNPNFERKIRYITDDHKKILSPVLVEYVVWEDNIQLEDIVQQNARRRTMPSVLQKIRTALEYRTTSAAFLSLKTEGIAVTREKVNNASRGHPTAVKQRKGRAPRTSYEHLENLNSDETVVVQEQYNTNHEDQEIRTIFLFKDAVNLFLHGCPTMEQHRKYREEIERNLDQAYFNTKTQETNESQQLKGFSSPLFYDTTFSLGEQLLTLLIGMIHDFRSKSGKCLPLILGGMLHNFKLAENHHAFGGEFAKMASSLKKSDKVPTAFISDGEIGLREFVSHEYFKDTKIVNCDFHLKQNLRMKFKKKHSERYFKLLFGTKDLENDITPGLLSCFDEETYNKRLHRLKKNERPLHDWVKKRSSLYKYHSARAKAEAGFYCHVLTNNVVECVNGIVKTIITGHSTGNHIISKLRTYVSNILKDCERVLFGEPSETTICLSRELNLDTSTLTSEKQRKEALTQFGLCFHHQQVSNQVPESIMKAIPEDDRTSTIAQVNNFVVYTSGTNHFVVNKNGDASATARPVKVVEGEISIQCSSEICRRTRAICVHGLAVFLKLAPEKQIILASDPLRTFAFPESKKHQFFSAKSRRGTNFSKNNFIRKTNTMLSKGFLDTPPTHERQQTANKNMERESYKNKTARKRLFVNNEESTPKTKNGRKINKPQTFTPG